MPFQGGIPAEELLERIIDRYSANYKVEQHLTLSGVPVRAVLAMHSASEKTLLGFSAPGLKLGSSQAHEYVLVLTADTFGPGTVEMVDGVLEAAEKQYLDITPEHSYTLFSVVVLAGDVDRQTLGKWKKFKRRRDYDCGWGLSRLALVDTAGGTIVCNGDGRDFGRILSSALG